MVERTVDKKIRVLRKLLAEPIAKEESQPYTWLSPVSLEIPLSELKFIIALLGLTIVEEAQDPFSDLDLDPSIAVSVNEKVVDTSSAKLKKYEENFPKRKKPQIREKTLELISQKIGNLDTGNNLVKFLMDCGVDKELIEYPNTKWRMIFDVLVYLSNSAKNEDGLALSKVIGGATHPLVHSGDKSVAEALRNEFNGYLQYDNFGIAYDKDGGDYLALKIADGEIEELSVQEEWDEYERQDKMQFTFLSKPENKEKISLLRKSYQSLMNVVFFFCEDPAHPTIELNQDFQYLYKLTNKTVNELGLSQTDVSPLSRNEHFFYLPFSNLFSAEKDCEERKWELSWQKFRPEMNAMYGDIEELYQEVNGIDVLAEPGMQEKLNNIQLSLSILKKKREIAKKIVGGRANKNELAPIPKLEIVGLKEGLRAIATTKQGDEHKFPYKLPAGTKWENFIIQFEDDENVFVQVKKLKHHTSYKEMGMTGRGTNPNPSEAWNFLKVLAKLNCEIAIGDAEARDKYKKQKELLAKSLQSYFSLDYDPFYPYKHYSPSKKKEVNSYQIKITLMSQPNQPEKEVANEDKDDLGIKEYLDEQTPQVSDGGGESGF